MASAFMYRDSARDEIFPFSHNPSKKHPFSNMTTSLIHPFPPPPPQESSPNNNEPLHKTSTTPSTKANSPTPSHHLHKAPRNLKISIPNKSQQQLNLYAHTINCVEIPHTAGKPHQDTHKNFSLYVLFGKTSWYAGSESNRMHIYDSDTNQWKHSIETPVPKRAFHSTVLRYDRESDTHELVIFGGLRTLSRQEKKNSTFQTDSVNSPLSSTSLGSARRRTGSFTLPSSGRSFTPSSPSSRNRSGSRHSPAYPSRSTGTPRTPTDERSPSTTPAGNIIYGDMWIYNLQQKSWYQIEYDENSLYPAPRYGHSSVYSKKRDQMFVLCGTLDMDRINEDFEDVDLDMGNNEHRQELRREAHKTTLWCYDFATNAWNRMIFPFWDIGRVSINNLVRSNFIMLLRQDYETNQESIFICFGAEESDQPDERLFYTFDLTHHNRWKRHCTTGSVPSLRDGSQYLYIQELDTIIVYGGIAKSLKTQFTPDNEVYELDIAARQWRCLTKWYKHQMEVGESHHSSAVRKIAGLSIKSNSRLGRTSANGTPLLQSSVSRAGSRLSTTGRNSTTSSLSNRITSSPKIFSVEPRGYGGSCVLPRNLEVEPLRFFIHCGLGTDRAILQSSFYFELNHLHCVNQKEIVPSLHNLRRDLLALHHLRTSSEAPSHCDVIFQFPFPLENMYAHSCVIRQSPLLDRWILKSSCNKLGQHVVEISDASFSYQQFGLLLNLMYGVYTTSDDWEGTAIMADLLKLEDIHNLCLKKLEKQSVQRMNEQPQFDRSVVLYEHFRKLEREDVANLGTAEIDSTKSDDPFAPLQLKTLDTQVLTVHRLLCSVRCPELLTKRSEKLCRKLHSSVVKVIHEFIYAQRTLLPVDLQKRVELLLNVACASNVLKLYELEEQSLHHLKRCISGEMARSIQVVYQKVGRIYGASKMPNEKLWKDVSVLCELETKQRPSGKIPKLAVASILLSEGK